MVWDVSELQHRFAIAQNADAVNFLVQTHPSAHSDLSDELQKSAEGLAGVGWFCPDVQSYAYVLLHTATDSIFAMALGMSTILYKLPKTQLESAVTDGGELRSDIGPGWISFNPFTVPVDMLGSRAKLRRWCRAAFTHAMAGEPNT